MPKSRASSIAISKLARYANKPASLFEKLNHSKIRYGNKAHDRIGRNSLVPKIMFVAVLLLLILHYLRA